MRRWNFITETGIIGRMQQSGIMNLGFIIREGKKIFQLSAFNLQLAYSLCSSCRTPFRRPRLTRTSIIQCMLLKSYMKNATAICLI